MKIKPCPFCARENIEVVKFHDTCYCVACPCGAEAPGNSVSENGAIRIWNRRRLSQKTISLILSFSLKGLNIKTENQLSNDKSNLVNQVQEIVEEGLCE